MSGATVQVILQASSTEVLVQELASREVRKVAISSLLPITPIEVDQGTPASVRPLAEYTDADWQRAMKREKLVRQLVERADLSPAARAPIARELGIGDRQLRRAIRRFQQLDSAAAFLPEKPGCKSGTSRLNAKVESVIRSEINQALANSPDTSVNEVWPVVRAAARAMNLRAPARSTVARRLSAIRQHGESLPSSIATEMRKARKLVRGSSQSEGPLHVAELDHTVVDVQLLEPTTRRPMGRPVLSLLMDRYTRVILGMKLGLEAPSRHVAGLCVAHAVEPKADWLKSLGLADACWPGYGLMHSLYMDNASEFHALSFRRSCQLFGIEVGFRPPGHPEAGGLIERAIGTLMTKVRLLPGSTFSRVLGKAPSDAIRGARFTLAELEEYLAREVSRYHKWTHSGIGMPPLTAWEQSWVINGKLAAPRLPANLDEFRIAFLPAEPRVVTREGIELFDLRYRCDALSPFVQRHYKRMVRFDPTNLSAVFLEIEGGHLRVPLVKTFGTTFSLWEWREVRAKKLAQGAIRDEEKLVAEIQANRKLIAQKAGTSRRLRDVQRLARQDLWASSPPASKSHANVVNDVPMEVALQCRIRS
jgi:putative transposase